jgi:hypothetical protein
VRRTYEVERAELGGGLVQAGVGRKDRAATLSLVANDPTHGDVFVRCKVVVGFVKSKSNSASVCSKSGVKRVARAPSGILRQAFARPNTTTSTLKHAHHFAQ